MDKCTREVRKQYGKNIITQCLQRPEGMTVKQWLEDNGICEQTYYRWLKRIRQETYELATTSDSLPAEVTQNEVTFAEVSFLKSANAGSGVTVFRPDITISTGSVVFGVSSTASDDLLGKVFEVIRHAR